MGWLNGLVEWFGWIGWLDGMVRWDGQKDDLRGGKDESEEE